MLLFYTIEIKNNLNFHKNTLPSWRGGSLLYPSERFLWSNYNEFWSLFWFNRRSSSYSYYFFFWMSPFILFFIFSISSNTFGLGFEYFYTKCYNWVVFSENCFFYLYPMPFYLIIYSYLWRLVLGVGDILSSLVTALEFC